MTNLLVWAFVVGIATQSSAPCQKAYDAMVQIFERDPKLENRVYTTALRDRAADTWKACNPDNKYDAMLMDRAKQIREKTTEMLEYEKQD